MRRQGKVVGTRARRSALSRRYIELERRSNKGEPPPVEGCPFCPPRRSTQGCFGAPCRRRAKRPRSTRAHPPGNMPAEYSDAPISTIDIASLSASRFLLAPHLPYRDHEGRVNIHLLRLSEQRVKAEPEAVPADIKEKLARWVRHAERWHATKGAQSTLLGAAAVPLALCGPPAPSPAVPSIVSTARSSSAVPSSAGATDQGKRHQRFNDADATSTPLAPLPRPDLPSSAGPSQWPSHVFSPAEAHQAELPGAGRRAAEAQAKMHAAAQAAVPSRRRRQHKPGQRRRRPAMPSVQAVRESSKR